MRIFRPLALTFAAVLVPFAQSAAQSCLGSNSFANGRMALGAQGSFFDGGKRFGAIGEYGAPKSWYADVTVGSTQYDGGGSSVTDFGGSLGYQIGIGDSPAEICPFGFAGYSTGGGAKVTSYGFGGSVGYRADASDNITIVPAAGLQWHGQSVSVTGYSSSASNSNIEFFGNVGIIVNKHWAIVPGVLKSNASGSKALFMVTLGYFWGQ